MRRRDFVTFLGGATTWVAEDLPVRLPREAFPRQRWSPTAATILATFWRKIHVFWPKAGV
jgi:hypothetical protein